MPRCPNCSYILVFLEKRCKYKCAKCGKLFSQKYIEDKEFKEWNQRQRILDKEALKQRKPRTKQTKEEKAQKAKEWRIRNKEKIKAYRKKYYEQNKDYRCKTY